MRLPAVRSDLSVDSNSGVDATTHPFVVVDRRLDHQLKIEEAGRELIQFLSEERSYGSIAAHFRAAGNALDPLTLFSYVSYFYRFNLFDGARFERYASWFDHEQADHPTELIFTPEARHLCQASGSCCGHTDIGPIPAERKRRLLSTDWTPLIAHIANNDALFDDVEVTGEHAPQITLLKRGRQDYCSFLDDDKLCTVHKTLGYEAKPLICRQFPFVFTQTPAGIAVSIMMECRDYIAAKSKSGPLQVDRYEALQRLVDEGATVHRMPRVIPVDQHLFLDHARYQALEAELLRTLAQDAPIASTLLNLRDTVSKTIGLLQEEQGVAPDFISRRAWKPLIPRLMLFDESHRSIAESVKVVFNALSNQLETLCLSNKEAGQRHQVNQLLNAQKALSGLFHDYEFRFYRVRDPVVHSVLRDILVNYIFSKEVLREQSLRDGLARGFLKVLLTLSLAITLASYGCRGEVLGRDVVDATVAVNKVFRDARVKAALSASTEAVGQLFFDHVQRFVGGNTWNAKQ